MRQVPRPANVCRLVVQKEDTLAEISQFVIAGLQIGQQVVAMAAPDCLKVIAQGLNQAGLHPEALLHNGRLVFLTAPDCLSQLSRPEDPRQRGPLRRNGPLLRWVSDWSWAYANGNLRGGILHHQRRIHEFIRSLAALSLCTVHCQKLERSALLALLADHRRAARA